MTPPQKGRMTMLSPLRGPAGLYVRAFLEAHAARVRRHWADGERGASAVELAVITGVLVVMAVGILALIWREVNSGQNNITQVIPTAPAGGGGAG
jgi:Flp pilus assembly pilin Flp